MFERESVLAAADRFLRDGQLRDAWRSLDRYSSNFPADAHRPNRLWEQARALSQEADLVGRVSIATWPDWALAAVSVTFDDRLPSHVDVVRPDLDRHKIPGTFFVIREHPSLPPLDDDSREKWRSLAESRHEIGNHTDTHPPNLSGLSRAEIVSQLNSCDRFIQSLHPVSAVTSFSYPYGLHGPKHGRLREQVRRRYLVGRSSSSTEVGPNLSTPPEMDALHSYSLPAGQHPDGIQRKLDQSTIQRGWMIFTIHEVEQGEGYGDIGRNVWNHFLDTLVRARDRLWFGTLSDVARYIHGRVSSIVQCDQTRENEMRLAITADTPTCDRDRMPLDVSVRVPSCWQQVRFTTSDHETCQLAVQQNRVLARVLPDGQTAAIRRTQ